MPLQSKTFSGVSQIQDAAQNAPSLRNGSAGPGVALLQAALVDLGHALPRSTKPSGAMDGIFGPETEQAVRAFQTREHLTVDGIAGARTIARLDALIAGKSTTPAPAPTTVPPPSPHYTLGRRDPPIRPDPGAGAWGSSPRTFVMTTLKELVQEVVLPVAATAIGLDAALHLRHYLRNTGTPLRIDLQRMTNEVPSANGIYRAEIAQAKQFVENFAAGRYDITSRALSGGYNRKSESTNWYFAVGGYSVWGKGSVQVSGAGTSRQYVLQLEYHMYDRYNWDTGKSVTIAGITITDDFMGEFHRQGLAKEYDEIGSFSRTFRWTHGAPIPPSQY